MNGEPKKLIEYLQAHERTWGTDTYPGRPALEDVLKSPVVAFWLDAAKGGGRRHVITLHDDVRPIQEYIALLVRRLPVGFPARRLKFIFINGQEMRIGVKVGFRSVAAGDYQE